jgi:radical SAM protein with 4Fe4S-binding SPASM domain
MATGAPGGNKPLDAPLRRVYWEVTTGCNLRCLHCRRTEALFKPSPEELTGDEARRLVDDLAAMGKPVLILSGGEPLFRKDVLGIAAYAQDHGLALGIATNGTLINADKARAIAQAGIRYASISLDGSIPSTHDALRGKGNYSRALRGYFALRDAGIKVQINFTVTRRNVGEVEEVYALARDFGASALYLFLLVPVGCGVKIADTDMLSPRDVEKWLQWTVGKDRDPMLPIKTICAPHFYRVREEMRGDVRQPTERQGCLAGIHMCFISHKGDVYPCGYLPASCGNIREKPLREIWESSEILKSLRDPELLGGRCGACSFKTICGGCRARAYYAANDFLAEEPACAHDPAAAAA